ncbi:MAG TPA: hypothetical protein VET65_06980 [Candidatus Limnocylindrales bacterium]|nr:hypothetical protein [Candidatus Limnocylindrales bacterium]
MDGSIEVWDLWMPGPGASGLSFARCRINAQDAGDRLLVHAAPASLDVTVFGARGDVVARGSNLKRGEPGPMSYLTRRGQAIGLEDGWPADADIGRVVLLPGGEAGILKAWWHAADRSEWRWQIEFYNHR